MRPTIPPPAPLRQRFDLPAGRVVEFSFTAPDLVAYEIAPWPDFIELDDAMGFLRGYIAAREAFLRTVATMTGLRISVVDMLPGGVEAVGEPIAPAPRQ